jgi:predicted chitinase
MPADVNQAQIDFDVAITPTEADANRFAQLLGETRFEAIDGNTNYSVILSQPAQTTDLEFDEAAHGKGVVRNP